MHGYLSCDHSQINYNKIGNVQRTGLLIRLISALKRTIKTNVTMSYYNNALLRLWGYAQACDELGSALFIASSVV